MFIGVSRGLGRGFLGVCLGVSKGLGFESFWGLGLFGFRVLGISRGLGFRVLDSLLLKSPLVAQARPAWLPRALRR